MGLFHQLRASLSYPYLFTSDTPQSAQQALAHVVQGGLFSSLNLQQKVAACKALLEIGSKTSSLGYVLRNLSQALIDTT